MKNYLLFFLVLATCFACRSEYEQLLADEMASGERHDSLFLDIYLGMTSKEFYAHCWELNKQNLIRQGDQNLSVWHELKDQGTRFPVNMNFYPTFHEDVIYEMPVVLDYYDWAPWNRERFADSLVLDVVSMMEGWYGGNPFLKLEHEQKGTAYVKVDGNRRILAHRKDDQYVRVIMTDMSLSDEVEAAAEKNEEQ